MKTLPHIRKQEILNTLRRRGSIDVQELARTFGVTYMTIHRDLQALEKEGLISRVYGGAVAAPEKEKAKAARKEPVRPGYSPVREENRFIAKAAAAQVRDGDIIALDGSTCALQMCPLLHEKSITVVTNGLNIALQFADSDSVQVLLTGGLLRHRDLSLVSIRNPDLLEHINIGKCFFSATALSAQKRDMEQSYEESEAKRELLRRSEQLYLLADHSKLGGTAPYVDCACQQLYAVVTDRYAASTAEMTACLRGVLKVGVRVIYGTL